MTIEFVRIERDCISNKKRHEEGGAAARGIIYDFDVIIDGEHRATWQRETVGVGYRLLDANGENIPDPERTTKFRVNYAAEIRKQADMDATAGRLYRASLIPTTMELAWARMYREACEENKDFHQHQQDILERKQRVAEQLFDALAIATRWGQGQVDVPWLPAAEAAIFRAKHGDPGE